MMYCHQLAVLGRRADAAAVEPAILQRACDVEPRICLWKGAHVRSHPLYLCELACGEHALKPFLACAYVTRESYKKSKIYLR
jgi:hypothetical protein